VEFVVFGRSIISTMGRSNPDLSRQILNKVSIIVSEIDGASEVTG
jgi:hypothetical protein